MERTATLWWCIICEHPISIPENREFVLGSTIPEIVNLFFISARSLLLIKVLNKATENRQPIGVASVGPQVPS